jgi:chromosome segregation ATPase
MPKHEPTGAEYQSLLEENDVLRREIVELRNELTGLRAELKTKDQTIERLELADRAKAKRMGDLHEQIYQLGVAKWDLETEVRNLKFDKEQLLERLADKQQYIIDRFQLTGPGDVLGGVFECATRRIKDKA